MIETVERLIPAAALPAAVHLMDTQENRTLCGLVVDDTPDTWILGYSEQATCAACLSAGAFRE